jgi:xanthine dehydrogenase accessory factor
VGLNLGGKTPAEIALAILAEVTALRHGVTLNASEPVRAVVAASA